MENHNLEKSTIEYLETLQEFYLKRGQFTLSSVRMTPGVLEMLRTDWWYNSHAKQITGAGYSEEDANYMIELVRRRNMENYKGFSKYEDPLICSLLNKLSIDVLTSFKKLGFNISEKIFLGTLPLGDLNAKILKTPFDSKIIVFNDGLFHLFNLLSKIVLLIMPLKKSDRTNKIRLGTSMEDLMPNLRNKDIAHDKFVDCLNAYFKKGNAISALQYYLKKEKASLHEILLTTLESFVLAHEYSHAYLEHFGNKSITNIFKLTGINHLSDNWQKEIEADLLAVFVTLHLNQKKGYNLRLSYLGIDFFYTIIELLDKIVGSSQSETHPPVKLRKKLMRKLAIKDQVPHLFDHVTELCDNLGVVLSTLYEANKGKIKYVTQL